jgi:hypothetical protein
MKLSLQKHSKLIHLCWTSCCRESFVQEEMPLCTHFTQCGTLAQSFLSYPIPCLSVIGRIPTKTPSFVQSSGSESSSISRPLHVFNTSCLFRVRGPNFILSVSNQSCCRVPLIVFSHQLWISVLVCIMSGCSSTRLCRKFHIRCHAADMRIANSCPFSGITLPLSDLNFTSLQPRIRPQLRSGH